MYSRTLEGQEGAPRSFGVSGKLWNGVLVMYDRETGSLWTQLDGRAIRGKESGLRLDHVPSVYTTWSAWKAAHPDTLVLDEDKEAREQEGSRYAAYFDDPDRLYMPRLAEGLGGIGPKDVVFGVTIDGEGLAVSESLLARQGIVNAVVAGRPVAFIRERGTNFAMVVERKLGDRLLILKTRPGEDPSLLFTDTLSGERHGADELAKLRVDRAYWYAWARSHPGSMVLAD